MILTAKMPLGNIQCNGEDGMADLSVQDCKFGRDLVLFLSRISHKAIIPSNSSSSSSSDVTSIIASHGSDDENMCGFGIQ